MADLGSAVIPPVLERLVKNKRTGEERLYQQAELPIEGEARLLGLVHAAGMKLSETDFPWDLLADLFSDVSKPVDWNRVIPMLGSVSTVAPDALAESALIFFGIYPQNEDGTRNPDYEVQQRFLKRALTFTDWVDLLKVFAAQNDYQRLMAPLSGALAAGARMSRPAATLSPNGT